MDSRGTSFPSRGDSTSNMGSAPLNRPSGQNSIPPTEQVESHWFDQYAATGYALPPDFKLDLDLLDLTPPATAKPQSERAHHGDERTTVVKTVAAAAPAATGRLEHGTPTMLPPRPNPPEPQPSQLATSERAHHGDERATRPPRPVVKTAAAAPAATGRLQHGMPTMLPPRANNLPEPQPSQPAVPRKRKHVADPDDLPAPTRPRLQGVGGSGRGESQPSVGAGSGKLVPRLRRGRAEVRTNDDVPTARIPTSRLRPSSETPRASSPPLRPPPPPSRAPEIDHRFSAPSTPREVRHIQDALLCTRLDFQRRTGLEPPATSPLACYAAQHQALQAGAADVWLLDSAPPVLYQLAGPWRGGIENWHGLKSDFDARVAGGFSL